jgi:hypothetical protein
VASWEVSCKILSNIFFSDLGDRSLDFAAATSILAVGILRNTYYIRCWVQLAATLDTVVACTEGITGHRLHCLFRVT